MSRQKKKLNYFIAKAALKNKENIKTFFTPKSRLARVDFTHRLQKYRLSVRHFVSPSYLEFPVSTKAIREHQILYKFDSENKIYVGYSTRYLMENYDLNPDDAKWCEIIELLRDKVRFADELHFNKEIEYRNLEDCKVLYNERDASKFSNI